jgi:hypothetical protein
MAGIEDDVTGNNDSGTIKGPVEVVGVDVHETSVWIVFSSLTCGCLLIESSIVEEDKGGCCPVFFGTVVR